MPRTLRAFALVAALAALAALAACSQDPPPRRNCVDRASSALRTCAGPDTLDGLDVSVWQGAVDWSRVAADGKSFVFMRVASGQNVDTRFATNWPAAKSAGLVRGAYQYFYPSRDVDQQIDVLVAELTRAGYDADDLPPVLDLETLDGLTPAEVAALAQHWLDRVEAELHVRPLVYTANFMSNVTGTSFSTYPLWVANYNVTCPLMPTGWSEWVFWQSSSTGTIAGISGAVDTDVFNGTLADLHAFAAASHLPPAPAPDAAGIPTSDASPDGPAEVLDAAPPTHDDAAPGTDAAPPAVDAGAPVRPAPRVRGADASPDPCAPSAATGRRE